MEHKKLYETAIKTKFQKFIYETSCFYQVSDLCKLYEWTKILKSTWILFLNKDAGSLCWYATYIIYLMKLVVEKHVTKSYQQINILLLLFNNYLTNSHSYILHFQMVNNENQVYSF